MKKTKFFLPFVALALVFGVIGCANNNSANGGNSKSSNTQQKVSIKVSAAENKTTLDIGDTVQLSAKANDADLADITWSSSNNTTASVSETGLVTALKGGSATITAKKDGFADGKITINVNKADIIVQIESGTSEGNVVTFKDSHNTDTDMVDAWPQNAVLTLTFNANKAGNYEIYLFARAHGGYTGSNTDVVADTMELKVNDVAVTLSGSVAGGAFNENKIGETALNAGSNTMTVKNLATDMITIDYFRLAPKA